VRSTKVIRKLNGVDPQAWLTDILSRIADHHPLHGPGNVQRSECSPSTYSGLLRLA
jgi:hypothetical protein